MFLLWFSSIFVTSPLFCFVFFVSFVVYNVRLIVVEVAKEDAVFIRKPFGVIKSHHEEKVTYKYAGAFSEGPKSQSSLALEL